MLLDFLAVVIVVDGVTVPVVAAALVAAAAGRQWLSSS
jgi:hypothetical protein